MIYKYSYKTPDGFSNIEMSSDGKYLTGLWFVGIKDTSKYIDNYEEKDLEIFKETSKWLDIYFKGEIPKFTPKYKIENLTSFRREVINIINSIGYGEVITYNDIAKQIVIKRNIKKMSAQAVGSAVRWNPICIIIPCHRVMGCNNKLTGYGGGINNKRKLLELEGVDTKNFKYPKSLENKINR